MGVLFDYFSAGSDKAAASTIDRLGGPGASPAGPSGAQAGALEGAPFDTVPLKGIDPLVQLGTLEALLTGRDYELIVAGSRAGHPLAVRDGGACMVVTLTDELQAVLAESDHDQLAIAAEPWSRTEEFWGRGDPEVLADVLRELAELARRAHGRDERMYCWVCV
jgi:hypothetical protein